MNLHELDDSKLAKREPDLSSVLLLNWNYSSMKKWWSLYWQFVSWIPSLNSGFLQACFWQLKSWLAAYAMKRSVGLMICYYNSWHLAGCESAAEHRDQLSASASWSAPIGDMDWGRLLPPSQVFLGMDLGYWRMQLGCTYWWRNNHRPGHYLWCHSCFITFQSLGMGGYFEWISH